MTDTRKSRHEQLQQELASEFRTLRARVRETAEGVILRQEGELETLLDYLLKLPPGKLKAVARPWLRETHGLKLKPAKGRTKDLKKIDTLLHDLLNQISAVDDPEQQPAVGKKVRHRGGGTGAVPPEPAA